MRTLHNTRKENKPFIVIVMNSKTFLLLTKGVVVVLLSLTEADDEYDELLSFVSKENLSRLDIDIHTESSIRIVLKALR